MRVKQISLDKGWNEIDRYGQKKAYADFKTGKFDEDFFLQNLKACQYQITSIKIKNQLESELEIAEKQKIEFEKETARIKKRESLEKDKKLYKVLWKKGEK